ncbi:hypothetical protein MA6G1108_2725 [Mycobacteroides abscessus 6G-1108]|nr:hypothetical protein MA6G1108_2725 [Mycobacteroides abscessus 6G-1108]EPZ22134.1 hypothetical protein M879_03905 [Mycobacteroides abscessus V06705]EUA78793.1 hypothetical protein I544_0077 [Mycobacteroides abscessus subsp. bolletii 103]
MLISGQPGRDPAPLREFTDQHALVRGDRLTFLRCVHAVQELSS